MLAVAIGALCAGAFMVLVGFIQRGEIAYAPEPSRAVRLWIVRDGEGLGLGLSTTRPLPSTTEGRLCAETTVRFLLTGRTTVPADVVYCECFDRVDGIGSGAGTCPEKP